MDGTGWVTDPSVTATACELALEGFAPPSEQHFGSHPAWAALRELGTELWLDTGSLDAARRLWTDEFSNLTTNNTLVNQEVQKGLFDELIPRVGRALHDLALPLTPDEIVYEVGFVLNCRVALRLVAAFGATVSVELHPGMAEDVELSVAYGRRYHAVCPERFIIKVPHTPAGLLIARRLASDGIPVNYTLGFSARQNVVAAAFSRPAYVNVFMGRLNAFVADNHLGSGVHVGEKATMASQLALQDGREHRGWNTLQIGASMRTADQVMELAGLDVFTMPVPVAEDYRRRYEASPFDVGSAVGRTFEVHSDVPEVLNALWSVEDRVYALAEALQTADVAHWDGTELAVFVRDFGIQDLFRAWSSDEIGQIRADGKIPRWERWRPLLESGAAALDDLMSVAALQSFVVDQEELDERIVRLLREAQVLAAAA